ncbi:hypothetical protein KP509_17G006300 [Ceratopteris richardii]|uniref:Uncharacterized protein n=1 Tax=Ceratopteris richardii TaxID=49495 RepID=A0A8T2SRS7_CERRI|nr:hypothetical protein KP509_17G006300 [Ceratopteris richardii]
MKRRIILLYSYRFCTSNDLILRHGHDLGDSGVIRNSFVEVLRICHEFCRISIRLIVHVRLVCRSRSGDRRKRQVLVLGEMSATMRTAYKNLRYAGVIAMVAGLCRS